MSQERLETLISREEIQEKVQEMARQISEEYRGQEVFFICVLKGAVVFLADLMRFMKVPVEIDFMAVSSYGKSTVTSGIVRILKDLETSIENRNVIIVEDIVDTGLTLSYLMENLASRNPASLKICTLLDKVDCRRVEVTPDYRGFIIPDKFVVGYGLDCGEKYRNLADVCVLHR
ncbi:MAG: hypoxanthine phosphoribosyltransferase [Candidatus Syntrophonatronum acetioxidans]|uniref:Hypoxanthine phosphoribosyltransferase n=1 Tax=Candidatus Syntrophonatronum acetioxidans TaxID=1795816 RepID=A0A424YAQ9_9FIRM|nr:MAG: hypoxanthine phosphoribosyltransferase [Candidatus Syntrophonatronum acetioxidans]